MGRALLELQAGHGLLDSGVAHVEELLGREVLEVDLVKLGGPDEDGVVGEVDGLGGLVRGELVPHHEAAALVTPLQDRHQVLVSSAQVDLALTSELSIFIQY